MESQRWFRHIVVLVCVVGMSAATGEAQFYPNSGMGASGQSGIPYYGYPAPTTYGDEYSYGGTYGPYYVPPPSSFIAPSFSFNANPYAAFPRSFSYEVPQNAYAPNSYTYDLRAYGYGYPPSAYPPVYAPPAYSAPWYPYGYYYPYYPVPRYQRGIYRQLSMRQYVDRQIHGPVRVRDFVRSAP